MSTDDEDELFVPSHRRIPSTDLDSDDSDTDNDNDRAIFPCNSNHDESNGLSFSQTAALCCKKIDIGTAVLPKPLFSPDVEDLDGDVDTSAGTAEPTGDGLIRIPQTPPTSSSTNSMTRYAKSVQREFNAVVVEHHLKWAPLCVSEPGPLPDASPSERLGRYDFHHADAIVDWCEQHGIAKIKGHVLVWHVTSPKFLEELEPAQVREQLKRHIFTVMGHYRGRISCWDVVNESLAPDGSLAETVFYRKLGPGYIEDCFRWAHAADPAATLLYNDNKVEGMGTPKSEGFYNLLADLKARDVPVHGCGIQAHFSAAGTGRNRPPTPFAVKKQINRLGRLGLTVNISEMDVRVSKLPLDTTLRSMAQRQIYHDILAAALSEPAFDGIWLWGFTDRHTWVHSFYYDDEPCVLDESYNRKEAYYGVRDAIATLTPGNLVGGQGVLLDSDVDADGNRWGYLWMQPDPENVDGNERNGGDSRPDWEQEETDLDSGVEGDIDVFSEDNAGENTDDSLPPIS